MFVSYNRKSTPLNTTQGSSGQHTSQVQSSHLVVEGQTISQHNTEKRHSFTGISKQNHGIPAHNRYIINFFCLNLLNLFVTIIFRHSAEIFTVEPQINANNHCPLPPSSERTVRSVPSVPIHDVQLPAAYVALYPYKPQKADELELKKGSIYIVTERWV